MKYIKNTIMLLVVLQLILLSSCSIIMPYSKTNKPETEISSEIPNNVENKTDTHLFEIYSEKNIIKEAIEEITLKHIEQIRQQYNEKYIEEGSDQRMEEGRIFEIVGSGHEFTNIVEGGSLYTYYLIYELKPKYTNEFSETSGFENLQKSGWLRYELIDLIIYHENSKINSPYYLAKAVLDDCSTNEMTAEQFLAEIVKNEIPQLKLLNN